MTSSFIAGVVPAAGLSRRVGYPKALLDAGGASFLERVVKSLREGGCGAVVVVVREGDQRTAELARTAEAEVLENLSPEEGPITSLRVAIRELEGEGSSRCGGLLFHPVDHPLVRPDTVRRIIEEFRSGAPPLVIPYHSGRSGHPILFSRALFPALLQEDLEEGARTLSRRHRREARRVEVDDEGILADIDTREEYREHFEGEPPPPTERTP